MSTSTVLYVKTSTGKYYVQAPDDDAPGGAVLYDDDLEFFASLTKNGGTGALFGPGGQLHGFYPHFERLARALPLLIAAAEGKS